MSAEEKQITLTLSASRIARLYGIVSIHAERLTQEASRISDTGADEEALTKARFEYMALQNDANDLLDALSDAIQEAQAQPPTETPGSESIVLDEATIDGYRRMSEAAKAVHVEAPEPELTEDEKPDTEEKTPEAA